MLEMRVKGICRCRRHSVPSLVLQDEGGGQVLAIGFPLGELERIAHEVGRGPACEPSIFTAFLEALRFTGARGPMGWLDLRGGELTGGIGLSLPGREVAIRCTPRDVAVLAAIAGFPVHIGHALACEIEGNQPGDAACSEGCEESASKWLERIRPEDFR